MTQLSDAERATLAAVEARLNAATPGQWVLREYVGLVSAKTGHEVAWATDDGIRFATREDVAFVGSAHEDIAFLLALCKRLADAHEAG